MMINIPSATGPGLPGAGSAQQSPVQQLMAQLNVKLGGTVEALATRVENMSSSQVMDLAKVAQTGSPQQQMVLNASSLKLVELRVQQQTLLTYTDQPVKAGDQLQVQFTSAKNLTLLPQTLGQQAQTVLANSNQTHNLPAALHTALMTALPKQQPLQQILNTLQAAQVLQNAINQQPQTSQQTQVNVPTQGANTTQPLITNAQMAQIQQALEKAPDIAQLLRPAQVKQAIQSSGLLSESQTAQTLKKLATQLRANSASGSSSLSNSNTKGTGQNQALNQALLNNSPEADLLRPRNRNQTGANPLASQANLSSGDLKSLLQNLLQSLLQNQQQAPKTSATPGEATTTSLQLPKDISGLLLNNPQLANALKMLYSKAQQGGEAAARQWLRDQVDSGIAKILMQQIQTLQSRPESGDTLRPQQWFFEIPFRQDGQVSELRLVVERQPQQEESPTPQHENEEENTLWKINLNFDLHELGPFCAHLAVSTNTVEATLYADTDTAIAKIQEHLPELEAAFESSGITVKRMQCQKGIPDTTQPIHHQPLVDVRT